MSLDWERFSSLSGATTENFEKLCRSIVRRQFNAYGKFRELKNQPGVEFTLHLNKEHQHLGVKDEIIGWQCKWFTYNQNGLLKSASRTKIEESLNKSKKLYPDLSKWILWTHSTLAKADVEWFENLGKSCDFELLLWNELDIESLMAGVAIDLRQAYFGELALTNDMLEEQHSESVAPIKSRWIHEAHQCTSIEEEIRQIIGDVRGWVAFADSKLALQDHSNRIASEKDKPCYQLWVDDLTHFKQVSDSFLSFCDIFNRPINSFDINLISDTIEEAREYKGKKSFSQTLSKLRSNNLPLALHLTDALAYIDDITYLLESAYELLSKQFIAVIADAGGGKTQLSAELTSENEQRPAGLLILGRELKKAMSLNDIAKKFVFYGSPVNSFKSLLTALDSAADRANCRLPIVIDGLNEAEDPREWKSLLESAKHIITKYPNLVLICTLRTGELEREHNYRNMEASREEFARLALPDDSYTLTSEGFGELTSQAIRDYFHLYKIKADPLTAPLGFFNHPLNLKIFCEVTNPKAENEVSVEYFPSSIVSLFSKLINHSIDNICSMTNLSYRYTSNDLNKTFYKLGELLWFSRKRHIPEKTLLYTINTAPEWVGNIINLLSQEGFIFRDIGTEPYEYDLTPVYDRLGGFLIADYLLNKNNNDTSFEWLNNNEFIGLLFGEVEQSHALARDVLYSLVALFPKYTHKQLWQVIPEQYQTKVLNLTPLIDREDICHETIEAYKLFILEDKLTSQTISQLLDIRIVRGHPLNADFFNSVFMELTIPERDLSWTEYIREHNRDFIAALDTRFQRWHTGFNNHEPDVERLRAISISWLLTSTCLQLRDKATQVLTQYGCHYPAELFSITLNSFKCDDPYVYERLLASSYAAASINLAKNLHCDLIANFARQIFENIFDENAVLSTQHILARSYASKIIQVTQKFLPTIFKEVEITASTPPYKNMPNMKWNSSNEERHESPIQMDFGNYTIGRLVNDRANYDDSHPDYKKVRGRIYWRIQQLGWDYQKYSSAEVHVYEENRFDYSRSYRPKVERYGKKLSWIAYYEMAGYLADKGRLREYYTSENDFADIDPFFPIKGRYSNPTTDFLGNVEITSSDWIHQEESPNLQDIYSCQKLSEQDGPWVLLDGNISEENKSLDRNFYTGINSFFIDTSATKELFEDHTNYGHENVRKPETYPSNQVYSGELYTLVNTEIDFESNFDITTGTKMEKATVPPISFRNGKFIREDGADKIHWIEVPQIKEIDCLLAVFNYYWEYSYESDIVNQSQPLLMPWIFAHLNLTFDPVTFEYHDENGNLAVIYSSSKSDVPSNYKRLLYLRKDLLDKLIEEKGFDLVWSTYSERRVAKTEHFHLSSAPKPLYKDFRFIEAYEPG